MTESWIKISEETTMGIRNSVTHVMEVPGGMLVRCATMVGISTTFVPTPLRYERGGQPFTNQSEIAGWIGSRKSDK
jgi:hypothetical protein